MLAGRHRAFPVAWLLLSCSFAACGGSTPAAESPGSADGSSAESGGDAESASGESSDGDGESSAAAEPAKPSCDDGTCSPCGDALCPSGWYCDESAPGGPACGWLPECAGKATCSCVKRAFSGCSCEDQSGSAHVRCG
jgi:hypothetical protein